MYLVRVREKIASCSPILQSGRNSNSIFDVVNLRLLPAFISVHVGTPLHNPVRDDGGRAPLEGPDACTTEVILELILPTWKVLCFKEFNSDSLRRRQAPYHNNGTCYRYKLLKCLSGLRRGCKGSILIRLPLMTSY